MSLKVLKCVKERSDKCNVLLMGLEGWPDAGKAGSAGAGYLSYKYGIDVIYRVDPDEVFIYSVSRPYVEIVDGEVRSLTMPYLEVGITEIGDAKILLARGHEPHRLWNSLIEDFLEIVRKHDVKLVVTLGSMLDDSPQVKVSVVSSHREGIDIARSSDMGTVTYSGPCSFYTVMLRRFKDEGIRTIGLWAHIPYLEYYNVLARYSIVDWRGAALLLEKFADIAGLRIDLEEAYDKARSVESILRSAASKEEGSRYFM